MTDVETVVVGGGAMGSSTAWALARENRAVLLVEQYEPRHVYGASHGEYRNFNVMYDQPHFAEMLIESKRLWHELEEESGQTVLEPVGMVVHGDDARLGDVYATLRRGGFDAEILSGDEAGRRWAGIRFDGPVLHSPDGGRVKADDSVTALQDRVRVLGGAVRHGTRMVGLDVDGDDSVAVHLESVAGSETITARSLVVTAGAWTTKLLGGRMPLPPLEVRQVQPAHFTATSESLVWPSFMQSRRPGARDGYWYRDIYGLLTPGVGVKIGWHGGGLPVDPDRRIDGHDAEELLALQRYVSEWVPGVDPDDFELISCTYTSTRTENFVLDRVGPVTVGAGFSGQGFKFTPSVGVALAGLSTGSGQVADVFRIDAHNERV